MADNVLTVETAESLSLAVDSEKNSLEQMRTELYGISKDVISSYKRYARSKDKVTVKRSARNLARLSKCEVDLGATIDHYDTAREKVQDALFAVIAAHDKYLASLYPEDTATAKRSSRATESYIKKIERFAQKTDDSVACIISHYTLRISKADDDCDTEMTQNLAYDTPKTAPRATAVHTNEVEISPVSIDIGPTVERAVERAIAELSTSLEKRIAETVSSVEIPVPESKDTAVIVSAAERLVAAGEAMTSMMSELDKMLADVGALVERCRTISEMQRCTADELSSIEEKQRAVNEEQARLVEAQAAVGDSLKEAVKVQKSLLKSNSKCIEKLDRQTKKIAK